jgi:bifunctional non-homologous end joining protein LigD
LLAGTLTGVKEGPFSAFIEPSLATARAKPPTGALWQYEIKLDGYRVQLHKRGDAVRMFTRSGLDWTTEFAPLCKSATKIPAHNVVLDGEVIVQKADGTTNFNAVKLAIGNAPGELQYHAFDILHLDGFDLRGAALADRRRVLEQLIPGPIDHRLHVSGVFGGSGADLFRRVAEMGLEGIVAKRVDQPYRSGRGETWIKVKAKRKMTLPNIGYVPVGGASNAALRLGRREGGKQVYAGKVGTGFSARTAQDVRSRLLPLHRRDAPLAKPLAKKGTIWVEPKLSAAIELTEVTDDGLVRHASFKGLAS